MESPHSAKIKVIVQAKLENDKIDSERLSDLLRSDMISEPFVSERDNKDMCSTVN